jgi:hypothetical protein
MGVWASAGHASNYIDRACKETRDSGAIFWCRGSKFQGAKFSKEGRKKKSGTKKRTKSGTAPHPRRASASAPPEPPPGTAGVYTLIERRWRCVQHYLFSCKASPRGCPDPTDLWADLWDLLPHESPACERVRLALHVDSFDADSVRAHCMPWFLDPFSFLQGCSRFQRDAVCSVIGAFVLLVGASVADDSLAAGSCVFALGLVPRSLSALALPPASRVAGRCPLPFRPARGAEAEAPLG